MPAAARLLLALAMLVGGWYVLFRAPLPESAAAVALEPGDTPAGAAGDTRAATLDAAALDALLVTSRDTFAAERWEESLEPTRQLVERFPGQHVFLARLAEIYGKLERPADEAAAWELFMDRAPLPADACPFIGHAYRRLGRYDRALDAFQRCFDADTRNPELAFFVGLGHEWTSRYDDAQQWYERAVAMAPPHYDSEVGLARLQLHRNRLADALRQATAVLGHVPDHVDAVLVAGLAEQRAGRRPQARRHLEKAAMLSADYFDVQLALGVLDYTEARYVAARARFELATRLDATRRDELQPWLERTATVRAAP